MNLKNTENFLVLGLFLAVLGLISAVLLAVFSGMVKEPIAKAELRNTNNALLQILPAFDNQPSENQMTLKADDMVITFMGAVKDGKLVAVAARGEKKGYAGAVQALIGFDLDGKIRSVLITGQNETPGLGANVCQRRFQKTIFNLFEKRPEGLAPNVFLDQFNGKSAVKGEVWKVKKDGGDIDYVTGATVTSRAITELATQIAGCFVGNRTEIIAKLSPAGDKK
ncbi:MAG: RnfABCDGE type electron transport complex subunit G [Victivallales bacterium]|jgi:electron transport complex protein RnfG|nr:RnfABCDGE type electron transport complex subunit G [Victivallales bacterium]